METTSLSTLCLSRGLSLRMLAVVAFVGLLALVFSPAPALADPVPFCSDLFPLEIAGPPASRVILVMVDVADRDDELSALVTFDGMDQQAPILIDTDLDQAVSFAMPMHPADLMGGGSARLDLRIGQLECPPVQLTIEPMQAAPGTALGMIKTLEEAIIKQAEKLGYSRDLLLSLRQGDVGEDIFALAVALQMLGGPDNPYSARAAIADAGAEMEIIDALMASSLLSEALGIVPLIIDLGPPPALSHSGRLGGGFASAAMGPALLGLSSGIRGMTAELQANLTPAQLDALMAEQAQYADVLSGASGFAKEAAGLAVASVGTLSVFGGPVTAAVIGGSATFLGAVMTAHTMQVEYYMGALPSQVQQINLQVSQDIFEEDSEQIGEWSASLTAMSTGYTLTYADIIGAVPGIGRVVGQAGKRALKNFELSDLPPEASFILELLDFSRDGLAKFIGAHDASGVPILTPQAFTARINANRPGEREFVQWSLRGADGAFALLADEHQYEPRREGKSELRVETAAARFQRQHRIANQDLTVDPIVVVVLGPGGSGGPIPIMPGDKVTLTATVDHALDRSLQWSALNGGEIIPLATPREGGPFSALFTAPEAPGVYVVEAESMSRTGPRRSGQPRRVGVISLQAERLRIDPTSICIEPGDSSSFRAFYTDGPDLGSADVTWSADAGTITSSGVYTAPRSGHSAIVTVEEKTDPENRASATIHIGGCDCRWVLNSSIYGRLEGDTVGMTGIGAAALNPPQAEPDVLDMFSLQGMEDLIPPEALEAMRQAQAGLDSMPAGAMPYPVTTFSMGADDLPGITVHWHVYPGGTDTATFTMPNGMIYIFHEELETSHGALVWSEIDGGLIRGQFNSRAGHVVSIEPEIIQWNNITGQFTMDPIPWFTLPGAPPMVGCPDPDPDD